MFFWILNVSKSAYILNRTWCRMRRTMTTLLTGSQIRLAFFSFYKEASKLLVHLGVFHERNLLSQHHCLVEWLKYVIVLFMLIIKGWLGNVLIGLWCCRFICLGLALCIFCQHARWGDWCCAPSWGQVSCPAFQAAVNCLCGENIWNHPWQY